MGCYQQKPSSRKLNHYLQNKYISHQAINKCIKLDETPSFNMLCDLAQTIAEEVKDKSLFNYSIILEFLQLISTQQINYKKLKYSREDTYSLVLKAQKTTANQEIVVVDLKIFQYGQNNSRIQAAKVQYALLQDIPHSNYIAKAIQQFDLFEKDSSSPQSPSSRFFVQEMELYQGNLREMIQKFKDNNTNPTEQFKEILVIQMLDALNLLHSRGIMHRNINSSNFLVTSNDNLPVILKLSSLSWEQKKGINNQNNVESDNFRKLNTPIQDIKSLNQSVQQDLIALGIVILELDNLETFDFTYVTPQEYNKVGEGSVFEGYKLNRSSFLFKIASAFLSDSNSNKQSAHSMLLELLKRTDNSAAKIHGFSIAMRNHLGLFDISIPDLQTKEIITENRELHCQMTQINQQIVQKPQSQKLILTPELIKSALETMLEWDTYRGEFDLLNVNAASVIFGAKNIKDNRYCVLKLSLCIDKADMVRQIGIMKICQTPNIVEFYGYRFFEDKNKIEFIVLEFEKCRYTLQYYLEEQQLTREEGGGVHQSARQKEIIMNQIIDSVDFLHRNRITHNSISLDNFLIAEESDEERGQAIIKLSNFKYATVMQSQEELTFFNEFEKYSPQQSDDFSLGRSIIILDNYVNYQEQYNHLNKNNNTFELCSQQHSNDINHFLQNTNFVIEKTSKIYQQAISYLQTSNKRTNQCNTEISHHPVNNCLIYSTINSHPYVLHHPNKLLSLDIPQIIEQECNLYLKQLINYTNIRQLSLKVSNNNKRYIRLSTNTTTSILSPLECLHNLTSFLLNLSFLSIGTDQAKSLMSPITNLLNLSYLSLDLSHNLINGISGSKLPLFPLQNLTNLSSLSINLNSNQIGEINGQSSSQQSLLSPINNLSNLSTLSLSLEDNSINIDKAKTYLNTLSNLINLMSLSVNLSKNEINTETYNSPQQSFLSPISSLTNLRSLSLNLSYNQIKNIPISSLLSPLRSLTKISNLCINLKSNQIEDRNLANILSPLSNLLHLQTLSLNLSKNLIRDTTTKTMLSPISNLQNLLNLSLNLSDNQISNIGAKSLLIPLTNLSNLEKLQLNLESNVIGPNGAQSLLSPLSKLQNLKSLDVNLFMSQIGNIGSVSLITPIVDLSNIQTLSINLSNNGIYSSGAKSLLSPLVGLYNLSTLILDLSSNNIKDEDNNNINYLLFPLRNLVNLSTLSINLSMNRIRDSLAKSLLSPISNLVNLFKLELNLAGNKINPDGVKYLLSPLCNLFNLQYLSLDIGFNYLGDIGIQYLLSFITRFSNITSLSLNLKQILIGDIGLESLVLSLTNLQQLSSLSLNLERNQLTDKGVWCLLLYLSTIMNLSSLQLDFLGKNKEIQKRFQHIPDIMFKNVKSLKIS